MSTEQGLRAPGPRRLGWFIALIASGLAIGSLALAQGDVERIQSGIALLNHEITQLKRQLLDAEARESSLSQRLSAERQAIGKTFMAMQRLSLSPRPLALIDPNRALDQARAFSVIKTLEPQRIVNDEAALMNLNRLRQSQSKRIELFENLSLAESQLDRLVAILGELEANGTAQSSLEAEPTALSPLDRLLETDTDDQVAQAQEVFGLGPEAQDSDGNLVLRPSAKPNDLREFSSQAELILPIGGATKSRFNDPNAPIQFRHGLMLTTSQVESPVLAPFDGRLVFSEYVEGFGHTSIIELGNNSFSILIGNVRQTPPLGTWVRQGEQVGVLMPSATGGGTARLFWQLRRNKRLVDPSRWL